MLKHLGNRIDEVACTKTMLERVESNYNVKPKRLMGDTAYGSAPMLEYLVNEKNIEPHIRVWEKSIRTDGTLSRSDFIWIEDKDHYQCPAGKLLQRNRRNFKKPRSGITKANTIIYRSSQHDCKHCEHKQQCCPNTSVRKVARSIYEKSRDVARAINQTEAFKKQSSAERKKVEMSFAHMKRNLNFHRLRLRGMKSANDECILTATAQNLRKLAKLCARPPPKHRISVPVT